MLKAKSNRADTTNGYILEVSKESQPMTFHMLTLSNLLDIGLKVTLTKSPSSACSPGVMLHHRDKMTDHL